MSSATLSELLDALDQGKLLLLPNSRAARDMRAAFDARQRSQGLSAWESAQALSWSQWTNSLWSELILGGKEGRLLLNAAQEHSVWRTIIADDASQRTIGSVDSLAELARSAWQLASDYDATRKLREFAASHDSRIFAAWSESFARHCAEHGYVSASQLNTALLEHVRRGGFALPDSLDLVGHGQIMPSQQALLAELRERGTVVRKRTLESTGNADRLVASVLVPNQGEERLLAVRWVREFLDTRRSVEPPTRVAVLVPNLAEEREQLEGVLREVLAPELQSIGADLSSTPWEFSGGVPLSSLAMVVDALELVRWTQGPLPLERVSSLLLSPYLGKTGTDAGARDAAARFDVSRLRRTILLRSEIDVPGLIALVHAHEGDRSGAATVLAWLGHVQEFMKKSGDLKRPRGFAEWMEFARGLLLAANWPGSRALTASEFEAGRAWESLLDLVSTLDFAGRRVAFASALQALELHVQKSVFTTPSMDATVQVMGVAEAEGSIFDAVLSLHVTDANWPAPERVHPLLPWTLQRALKMPGSDPDLAASNCRALTENLLRSSNAVLFCHAAEDENGNLRPSPIMDELGIESIDAAELNLYAQSIDQLDSEIVADDVELPQLPSYEVAGGASVLKLQAACGFLAFAELRLRASELRTGTIGLDAGESGSLLHRVLQYFWRETKTQDRLRLMSWTDRDEILTRAIDSALPRRLQLHDGWDRAYLWLQKHRLRTVLQQWLEQELRRGPFAVSDVERKELVTVGPLTLEVRVDRVDTVGRGLFFVDYKTGADADPQQWLGPRPDDPQLPLYTLLAEADELKGVAFAKVRAGRDMKWQGYQAEHGILPRSASKKNIQNMASLAEEWRHVLAQLAEDFAAGKAEVHPKSFAINCTRCAQRLLCRIDPSSLAEFAEEVGEEAEDAVE
ncbi:MAG TPA: PD-(D/E)XK nuclease family protein [Acidobacteriaceae bacterium]|nr:PD-(D/E)XK nuclease family protein [Acidobacteriaceae bacterium]